MDQRYDLLDTYNHPWLVLFLAGVVAIAIALLAHAIAFKILVRLTRFSLIASTIVEFTLAPGHLVLPLLVLQFVMAAAPADVPFAGVADKILSIALIGALTWLAMRSVAGLGEATIRLHPANTSDNLHARRIQTQTRVLTRTVMFFLLLIGAASALMSFPGMRQI